MSATQDVSQKHDKMPKLPENATLSKRPLHRPAIPSAYASAEEQKVVYVSAKTPFMSAVKRIEKLLGLIEKRTVQSAAARVRNGNPRKRRRDDEGDDEIADIARVVAEQHEVEAVIVKATGKAISRALEIGVWFQQRAQYGVQLTTSTVQSIDDIEVDDPIEPTGGILQSDIEAEEAIDSVTVGTSKRSAEDGLGSQDNDTRMHDVLVDTSTQKKKQPFLIPLTQTDETRIRYVSVIEVHISMRRLQLKLE